MDDSKECLVRWEEGRATSEGVALHHALTCVLRKNLNDTTAIAAGSNVPLEITTSSIEDSVELVRHQFIGREDTERGGISVEEMMISRGERREKRATLTL